MGNFQGFVTLSAAVLASLPGAVLASSRAPDGIRVEVDAQKLGVDDTLTLSIVFEGSAADVSPNQATPVLTNLEIVGGPSSSMQMSFVNGAMSRSRTLSYVLRPLREGRAEIGAIRVSGFDATPAIVVEVVKGSIRPAEDPPDPMGRDPFFGGRDPFEEFFGRARRPRAPTGKVQVAAEPSRTRLRVGESLRLAYNLFTQVAISGVEFSDAPKYPGFWAEDLPATQGGGEVAQLQGEEYRKVTVLERLLIPTRPGTIEIPAARLRLALVGGAFGVAAPLERRTDLVRIVVDPLPDGAPSSGAVGAYAIEAALDRDDISQGEAATLRFRVSGRGNLKWIDAAPDLQLPGVKVFPPRLSSQFKPTPNGLDGWKSWEYVLVPGAAGAVEIPPLSFSYFDDAQNAVREAKTSPLVLNVRSAAAADTEPDRGAVGAVPLRGDLSNPPAGAPPLLLLALAALGAAAQLRRAPRGASGTGRRVDARTVAAAVEKIEGATKGIGKERAATLISEALESAFGPPVEWPADDRGDALRTIQDELQFLRFAPQLGSYDEKVRDVADRAIALVRSAAA